MEQMTLFECCYEKYKITKPIRLIELFSGYGSQALALKYLGVKFEHWRICEWATKSMQAYNDLHIQDYTDYSKELTQEEVINKLSTFGISMNYNEPMTYDQIKRKDEQWQRKTYNNIISTHSLVNIKNAKAKDLNIIDTDLYEYILTYSFPCQDLSLAGKGKGMAKDSGTRSGMLWEVERLLKQCKELPQILVMENVPQVIETKSIKDFQEWLYSLKILGYSNFIKVLNAKDYGIPQNRKRCFMISILKEECNFNFPCNISLKNRLKDLLETDIEEKYYLSDKMVSFFNENSIKNELKGNGFRFKPVDFNKANICKTITTRAGSRMDDNFIIIPEKTKKGYAEARNGDGVYINRPYQKRGVVQKGMIQTLKTSPDVGVVVASTTSSSFVVKTKNKRIHKIIENNDLSDKDPNFLDIYNQKILDEAGTLKAGIDHQQGNIIYNQLRIRKLTPKECWRLMGVKDEDYNNVALNQSNSSLYHLAGDSIVTTCLMGIFGELLGIDYNTKINELVEGLKQT